MIPTPPSHVALDLPPWLVENLERRSPVVHNDNEQQMAFVLEIAAENSRQGGGPFAAAVYGSGGELVSLGVNRVVPDSTPIAHAEIMAIAAAGQALGTWDVRSRGEFTLVSSTEPCAMCMGAVPWAGVRSLVIGARDEDARAVGFDEGNKPADWREHLAAVGITVTRDLLRDEAAKILLDYASSGAPIYNGSTA